MELSGYSAGLLVIAASALAYVALQVAPALLVLRRATRTRPNAPQRVSVLKPIAGADDDLRANLESFAELRYSDFELLLGFATLSDPGVRVARAFLAAHPALDARIVWTDPRAAINPKVAQLMGLTRAATGSVLVVSDSNVRVGPDYLYRLLAELLRPGVGLVSSVVVGTGSKSLGAALDAAQLAAFLPLVIASRLVGRPISVGKSLAMRRVDLERIGGWRTVGDVLAEDDVLGQRFSAHGFAVDVCLSPIENRNVRGSVRQTFDRYARWAKMRRRIAPTAFALEPLLNPTLVATAAALTVEAPVRALAACAGLQMVGALVIHAATRRGWPSPVFALVEPARVLMSTACWLNACVSRHVCWRGHTFWLGPGSSLMPPRSNRRRARPSAGARAA